MDEKYWNELIADVSAPKISTREGNDLYPVLLFDVIQKDKEKAIWFNAPEHNLKTKEDIFNTGIISEVVHSRIGKLLEVPTVHNDFAYIRNEKKKIFTMASKIESQPGQIMSELSHMVQRCPERRLFRNPIDKESPEFAEVNMNYLFSVPLNKTTPEFKKALVEYYLFSQFINHDHQTRFNNVPIWAKEDARRYPRKMLSMAPAYDFENAMSHAIEQFIGGREGKTEELFTRPLNEDCLKYIIANYPETIKEFMEKLSITDSAEFQKICDLNSVKNFFIKPKMAAAFGQKFSDGYKKRTKFIQKQYTETKNL